MVSLSPPDLDFEQNFECDQKPGFLHLCAILCSLKPVDSGRFLGQGKQKPGFLSAVQSPILILGWQNPCTLSKKMHHQVTKTQSLFSW
jgi:hypothetical protein